MKYARSEYPEIIARRPFKNSCLKQLRCNLYWSSQLPM